MCLSNHASKSVFTRNSYFIQQSSAESNEVQTGVIIIEPEEPKLKVTKKRKPSLPTTHSRIRKAKIEPVVNMRFIRNIIKIMAFKLKIFA